MIHPPILAIMTYTPIVVISVLIMLLLFIESREAQQSRKSDRRLGQKLKP
jgi:hypothetical protein